MVTSPVVIAFLGALALIAIALTCLATLRARAARAALRSCQATHLESVERARKMEAGSRLAGDVAHELNDLLTAITGHTELLIASLGPSGPNIQDVQEIRRAAVSAARLTKPLRALSGGRRAQTDVIDVNAVTARTAGSLDRMLGPTIEVTLALDNDIKRIKVGASHLEEILLNLGIYARDAMPNGGRLTVATTMHTPDGREAGGGAPSEYVRMIIADTGGGMSAAAQSRLFEPFLATDQGGGSAAGLAKVDAIVRQAGGRIDVESTAGVGTTFTIDLPATSEPTAAPDPAFVDTRLTAPVLVVEDDPRVRELIRLVLVRAGHEVMAVAGPHAALAALNRQPAIPLMLVDVVMPEMDGYDLVVEGRKISPCVHVVFMSGFARDAARHPRGDGFLAKPFTVESLTCIVQETLAAP
jgi:two-component system, cell cycle sensor histidine kinase and response regulator CckA